MNIDKNSKLFEVDIFDVIEEKPAENLQKGFAFERLTANDQKLLRQVIQEEERIERKAQTQQDLQRKEQLRKLYKAGKVAKPLSRIQSAWRNYESKNK